MALGREDHKRIALGIAAELKKVLGDHNGKRILDRHAAKHAPAMAEHAEADPVDDDSGIDDVMSAMSHEPPTHEEDMPPKKKMPGKVPFGRKC